MTVGNTATFNTTGLTFGATGSTLAVASGGTVSGTGTVHGALTLNSGGKVSPGNSIGTLTVDGNFTWNGGGTLEFQLDPGNSSDRITLSSGAFLKGTGSTFLFDFLSTGTAGNTYTLVSSTVVGTFAVQDFTYNNLAAGLSGEFSFSGNDLMFSVSAIPEPSTYAAIFGVAALGFAAWRRRQQRPKALPVTPPAA
jgi:hypothetical protein